MAETIQVKATKTEDAKEQKRRALTQILTSAKCLDDPVSLDEKVIDKEFVIVEKQVLPRVCSKRFYNLLMRFIEHRLILPIMGTCERATM